MSIEFEIIADDGFVFIIADEGFTLHETNQ